MVRVVVAGHVNWDVTLRLDALPEPDGEARILSQRSAGGGSAGNVAAALAGLDVATGVVGSVGDDRHGRLVREELADAGVDRRELAVVPGAQTSVKYLLVAADDTLPGPTGTESTDRPDGAGEVMVLGNDGANEALAPEDVDPAYIRAAEHLHLTGQAPATAAALAELAADAGLTVSFDPGRRLRDRDYGATLALADLVFVNEREANALLADGAAGPGGDPTASPSGNGTATPSDDGADRVVVVKHGACGATVHTSTGEVEHPGFGIDPVDTTGAGDAFAAGFLAVRLAGGDYGSALAFANACGALAACEEGARTAPTRLEVDAFLDERR